MNYKLRFRLVVFGTMILGLLLFFSHKKLPGAFGVWAGLAGLLLFFITLTLVVFIDFDNDNIDNHWPSPTPPRRGKRGGLPDAGPPPFSSPQPRLRNLIDSYRTDASFRSMIWLHFFLMVLGAVMLAPYMSVPFTDSQAWLSIPGALLFLGSWMVLAYRINGYLKTGRPDKDAHLTPRVRRMKHIATFGTMLALPVLTYLGRQHTQNLLSEAGFFLLFIPLSVCAAFIVAWFLSARIPGLPEGTVRWEFRLVIWVLFFFVFLAGTGVVNRYFSSEHIRTEQFLVVKKRQNYQKKVSVMLHVNGKTRKFRPTRKEWENIREQDSITVVIRSGALGFDFIEKFGVK